MLNTHAHAHFSATPETNKVRDEQYKRLRELDVALANSRNDVEVRARACVLDTVAMNRRAPVACFRNPVLSGAQTLNRELKQIRKDHKAEKSQLEARVESLHLVSPERGESRRLWQAVEPGVSLPCSWRKSLESKNRNLTAPSKKTTVSRYQQRRR